MIQEINHKLISKIPYKIKRILGIIWDEFIYGCHLLVFGTGAIVISTAFLLDKKIDWSYPIIIYLTAYAVYLFNRYHEVNLDILTNPERTKHLKKYINFVPIILIFVLLIIIEILVYYEKISFLPFIILLFLGGLFYTVFFKKVTKQVIAFKNFYVALEWTLPVILIPIYYSFSFTFPLFLIAIFVYLKTFMINSYFDVKDIETDKKEKLLTLPVSFKLKNYLTFLTYLNFLFALIIILSVWFKQLPNPVLILLLTIPFNLYVFKETEKAVIPLSKLYFLASGEFILWPFLLLVGEFIL